MSSKLEERTGKKQTDYSKLDVVNLSFNRPAKWYMYVVKQVLKAKKTVEIRARPSGAAQVVRVSEALKRLGYIVYKNYQTTTVITDGKLQRYIIVTVEKTKDVDKLFAERENERNKMIEEREKAKENKK